MYKQLPIFLTGVIGLFFIVIIFVIIYVQEANKRKEKVVLKHIKTIVSDGETLSVGKPSLLDKYADYWQSILVPAGIVSPDVDKKNIALNVTGIIFIVYALFLIMFMDVFIGIIPAFLSAVLIVLYGKQKIKVKKSLVEEQVPAFLQMFKSSIQANISPETAFVDAIEKTANPLQKELLSAKELIEVGAFSSAMTRIRITTTSKYLKFLCSCIELASDAGANLESQITTIEEMLEKQKMLDRQLDKAYQENKPLIYVASFVIPGLFIFMYAQNEQARNFWFKEPLSWAVLIFIGFIVVVATIACRAIINKTTNNM